jgi:RNA polymerase sigma-70 factor (ECF subfamily)
MSVLRQRTVSDEHEWLAAARRGESWALERCYEAYQRRVYALCYRVLGRAEDAQDAMQTAFVQAFREISRFRGEGSLRNWLFRIAVNAALRIARRRRDPEELVEETAEVEDDAPGVVERLAVRAALARTSPVHRAILILHYWEELSYDEITGVLGISLPMVKMRLHRARQEFRKWYEQG